MVDPSAYFTSLAAREFAAEAWKLSTKADGDGVTPMVEPHNYFLAVSTNETERRIIRARNWVTGMRDQDLFWGGHGIPNVQGYWKTTYKRDFVISNGEIADVEHFYTSAMMTAISGAFYLPFWAGSDIYEIVLQPLGIMVKTRSIERAWNNLKNNWKQLKGPDSWGAEFALRVGTFSYYDVQQFFKVEPKVAESAPLPAPKPKRPPPAPAPTGMQTLPPVTMGQTLSSLAREWYQSLDLWPLLWDLNREQVPNPNRLAIGTVLKFQPLASFTATQVAEARKRAPTWRNYPA